MVEQIFFSPKGETKVKRSVIVSNALKYTSCFTSCRTCKKCSENYLELFPGPKSPYQNQNFVSTSKNLLKNRN